MNERQRAFALAYLATGNAAEAARRAGYSARTANRQGHRLLTDADIAAYIDEQRARMESERIATATEALETLTAVMRGQIEDAGGRDVAVSDRIRAATELLKREGQAKARLNLTIIDDISREL